MNIEVIGWVWLGIIVGLLIGIFVSSMMSASKFGELHSEILHLRFVKDSLKEEIFKLDNQSKPMSRAKRKRKRNLGEYKAKVLKIGK